jgi:hypothetical protein
MTLLRERERSDDNDARAFLLSNTAGERGLKARQANAISPGYAAWEIHRVMKLDVKSD